MLKMNVQLELEKLRLIEWLKGTSPNTGANLPPGTRAKTRYAAMLLNVAQRIARQ